MKHFFLFFAMLALFANGAMAADEAADPLADEAPKPVDPVKSAQDQQQAGEYVAAGLQAMQDSNNTPERIIDAALSFTAALHIFQELGDTEKMRDMNANIFWCKKRMNLDDLNTYLAKKGNDQAVADSIAQMNKAADKEIPKDQADEYFARATKFAEEHKTDYLQIAIRYFEVAERFQGTPPSLKAQRLSLDALQQYTKAFAESQQKQRLDTLFTKSAAASTADQSPAPDAATQKATLTAVKKLYKDEYAGAKDAQKKKFAWTLYDQAKASTEDPATRFVMLSEAVRLAQSVQDVHGILTFTDEIGKSFSGYDLAAEKRANLGKLKSNEAAAAVLKLLDEPDNTDANTKAGKYFCLQADQWDIGLPMLSLGSDADWKQLADMELEKPGAAPQQIELGDLWYDTAGKNKPLKEPCLARARHWYKQALSSAAGASKTRITQRLDEIFGIVPDPEADYNNLTASQWDKLKGTTCSVVAKGARTDSGINLSAGQKVRVVPHPTDSWNADYMGKKSSYDWKGETGFRYMRNELRFMELGMFLDNGEHKSLGVISGPGHLYFGPDDPYNMAAGGAIRVKILPVDE